MLKETGKVVAVDDDGLWVETLKQSACAACAAKHGCGQKLIAKASASSNMTFIKALFTDSSREHGWSVGDNAVLGVNENALVIGALVAYGVPLISMILGAFLGNTFAYNEQQELMSALGAVVGLVSGGLSVRYHQRHSQKQSIYQAYVVGKVMAVGE